MRAKRMNHITGSSLLLYMYMYIDMSRTVQMTKSAKKQHNVNRDYDTVEPPPVSCNVCKFDRNLNASARTTP